MIELVDGTTTENVDVVPPGTGDITWPFDIFEKTTKQEFKDISSQFVMRTVLHRQIHFNHF